MSTWVRAQESFGLNSNLDIEDVGTRFRRHRRVTIRNFLTIERALELYRYLSRHIIWNSFAVFDCNSYGLSPDADAQVRTADEKELLDLVNAGAERGFASCFETDRAMDSSIRPRENDTPLAIFSDFMNSNEVLSTIRAITGEGRISATDVEATRFRRGHFLMFQGATNTLDASRKKLACYKLGLTPTWKPEWGGLLEFRSRVDEAIEAHMPRFNALELFSFPQGHWISVVSPFSQAARLDICGSFYCT